jgi:hypothetical protein
LSLSPVVEDDVADQSQPSSTRLCHPSLGLRT